LKAKEKRLKEAEIKARNAGELGENVKYTEKSKYHFILDAMATWDYWQQGGARDKHMFRSHDEVSDEYSRNNKEAFANDSDDEEYMNGYRKKWVKDFQECIEPAELELARKATDYARAA